jgi:hypothetical protein
MIVSQCLALDAQLNVGREVRLARLGHVHVVLFPDTPRLIRLTAYAGDNQMLVAPAAGGAQPVAAGVDAAVNFVDLRVGTAPLERVEAAQPGATGVDDVHPLTHATQRLIDLADAGVGVMEKLLLDSPGSVLRQRLCHRVGNHTGSIEPHGTRSCSDGGTRRKGRTLPLLIWLAHGAHGRTLGRFSFWISALIGAAASRG